MSKKVVGLFTSVEGHLSIAEAIEQILENEFEVEMYRERDELYNLYMPLYQFFPFLFSVPFYLIRQKRIIDKIKQYLKKRYQGKLRFFYRRFQPDILINTYYMYNPSLQEIADENQLPFINVLTDPHTVHPLLIAEHAQTNLAFDDHSLNLCHKYFSHANIQKIGWFVRAKYEQSYNQLQVREKLHLKPDVLTILIASGSEGTNIVATILPSLIASPKAVQVLVACGNNKTLYRSMKVLSKHLPKNEHEVTILPIPFTKELHLYMQAADLVVGKAGPNTLFEAVATQTPFFAITHIAGQEDGNLDIIREYQLGFVEENMFKANSLLRKIIRHPEQLKNFQPHLQKMAAYNAASKQEFKNIVHQMLAANS